MHIINLYPNVVDCLVDSVLRRQKEIKYIRDQIQSPSKIINEIYTRKSNKKWIIEILKLSDTKSEIIFPIKFEDFTCLPCQLGRLEIYQGPHKEPNYSNTESKLYTLCHNLLSDIKIREYYTGNKEIEDLYCPPKGPSGRPRFQEDEWAWQKVFINKRDPGEVLIEWKNNENVKKRNLQDPDRHFKRITNNNYLLSKYKRK